MSILTVYSSPLVIQGRGCITPVVRKPLKYTLRLVRIGQYFKLQYRYRFDRTKIWIGTSLVWGLAECTLCLDVGYVLVWQLDIVYTSMMHIETAYFLRILDKIWYFGFVLDMWDLFCTSYKLQQYRSVSQCLVETWPDVENTCFLILIFVTKSAWIIHLRFESLYILFCSMCANAKCFIFCSLRHRRV